MTRDMSSLKPRIMTTDFKNVGMLRMLKVRTFDLLRPFVFLLVLLIYQQERDSIYSSYASYHVQQFKIQGSLSLSPELTNEQEGIFYTSTLL